MQKPISGETFRSNFCKKVVDFCEHWFVKNFLRPVFFLMPPMLVTNAVMKQGLKEQITELMGPTVGGFINNSALLVLLCAYLYVVIVKLAYSAIAHYSKPEKELSRDDMLAILKSLNTVVGDKSKRMSAYAKNHIGRKDICAKEAFLSITKPDQQLSLLVAAIKGIFEFLDSSNASYRVGLISVEKRKPSKWVYFEPTEKPPRTNAKDLSAPSSTVANAIATKSIVVVEDISKEMQKRSKGERRYLAGSSKPGDHGSQLCYPIIHPATGSIEYVITVAGDKTKCLEEKHANLYAWILEHFSLRIGLEHSLLILRERADEQRNAA